MRVQLTNAGLQAIYHSMSNGIKFQVSYFKIGRAILPFEGEDYTDTVDTVYPTPGQPINIAALAGMMRYYFSNTSGNQAVFEITLDETIGDSRETGASGNVNFVIGNIGLFYHDPANGSDTSKDVMLAIASNEIPVRKYRKVSVNEAADVYRDYIALTFQDISKNIQVVDDIKFDYTNIPAVETLNNLPIAKGAPYNMYIVNNNNYISAIAVKRQDYLQGTAVWDIYQPNSAISVSESAFDANVGIGTAVCFKQGLFQACDGSDATYPYVGIRTSSTTIQNTGNYTPSMNLTLGAVYYVGNSGQLTKLPTLYAVGLAVSYDTLALFYSNSADAQRIDAIQNIPTVLLGDKDKFKVTAMTVVSAGVNYVSGIATVNGIPVTVTASNGAITAISGWPAQVFAHDPAGSYPVVQVGNQSATATIVTSYAVGDTEIAGSFQYVHSEDPLVQKSYLRSLREKLYALTEKTLSDFNDCGVGEFMCYFSNSATNAPPKFSGGWYVSVMIKNSADMYLHRVQSMSNPRIRFSRTKSGSNAWSEWTAEYAEWTT